MNPLSTVVARFFIGDNPFSADDELFSTDNEPVFVDDGLFSADDAPTLDHTEPNRGWHAPVWMRFSSVNSGSVARFASCSLVVCWSFAGRLLVVCWLFDLALSGVVSRFRFGILCISNTGLRRNIFFNKSPW